MKNNPQGKKVWRPAAFYKLVSKVRDREKRNLLRGYSAKPHLSSKQIEAIRSGNSAHDNLIAGAVLKGDHGLLSKAGHSKKKTSGDLYTLIAFPPVDWRSEVRYTVGYINSMSSVATEMLFVIKSLARLETMESNAALQLLLKLSEEYGASNFLSYKLAYLKTARDLETRQLAVVSKIEDEICHRSHAGMHFSALENLSPQVSLFVVAQRRISGLAGKIDGDFRKAISLSNFIPTPLNKEDVAGYLLRATESSLLDSVYAILVIFNLKKSLGDVWQEFEAHLDAGFLEQLLSVIEFASHSDGDKLVTDHYRVRGNENDPSLNLYRISSAFLECPKFAEYRNRLDRVIGARLLEEIIGRKAQDFTEPFNNKQLILAPNTSALGHCSLVSLDSFYRTFLFLRFLSKINNLLNISDLDIKFIFENTVGLEMLLTEQEMRALHAAVELETKSLTAVLSLALFRKKSIDPDVDYEFRADFISHVNDFYDGSIAGFIDSLLRDSPGVAQYIVNSLDEVTLEKMYTLVKNSSEASKIRCAILKAIGKKLNRIEYFIEADAITTRSKVSNLMQYFDSSRMYVDSVSMKNWLDSNPTVPAQEYRSLFTRIEAKITAIGDKGNGEANVLVIHINDQNQYLIEQIAEDAFEQFCLNTEFGIESYLGRRIRHNTLDGVTTDTVDAVLRKHEYKSVFSNPAMVQSVNSWLASYKSVIERLRGVHLQFSKSGSLFHSRLDLEDATTKDNIRQLSKAVSTAGGCSLLNDLVIAFCWHQITPQLENAARFIKTTLLQEANYSIDKFFSSHCSAIEEQMKSELHEAVNEVFKKIADWFQVPQTGFVSASVRDLCQIILIELNRQDEIEFSGDAVDKKYTGMSVHRIYDCLAVLLKNAHKHSGDNQPILVEASASRVDTESKLESVEIDIVSAVAENDYEKSKKRVFSAIDSTETGTHMVTEGYTGINKIKFITRASQGVHTIRCTPNDSARKLRLGFTLHAETGSMNDQAVVAP